MSTLKRVAIIGAGPSGLVTTKTLLHDTSTSSSSRHGTTTYSPVIFEKQQAIGGLWPTTTRTSSANGSDEVPSPGVSDDGPSGMGTVPAKMRTNLSRFTVAFSDLSWETALSVDGVPMFPQAWQVGKYLETYRERYIPSDVLRLGCEVVETIRQERKGDDDTSSSRTGWIVKWTRSDEGECVRAEFFDYLVVASGYFSSPAIPDNIMGLSDFRDRTIHTSELRHASHCVELLQKSHVSKGKIVVIGGSMSGAEAASALALHLSSLSHSDSSSPPPSSLGIEDKFDERYEVHHVCTRPFWTAPTYLPQHVRRDSKDTISFLPLDLIMYDMSRRPPGPITYSAGPVAQRQVVFVNQFFERLLGPDSRITGGNDPDADHETEGDLDSRVPWIAIGNEYSQFFHSGAISVTMGRVTAVHRESPSGNALMEIKSSQGSTTVLEGVAAIILATGYTPATSLSFLPPDVLAALEYAPDNSYCPLILDQKGTIRSEVPNLGFVGFYRGPYWGVMEMQARSLAAHWQSERQLSTNHDPQEVDVESQRQQFRDLRRADTNFHRTQFPMGDYTGLMESFATDLRLSRLELADFTGTVRERTGPVVPARYPTACQGPEVDITLRALQAVIHPDQSHGQRAAAAMMSMAVFRALHGSWKVSLYVESVPETRDEQSSSGFSPSHRQLVSSGTAIFYPVYPSASGYEKEHIYEEVMEVESTLHTCKAVYRLRDGSHGKGEHGSDEREDGTTCINIWTKEERSSSLSFSHGLKINSCITNSSAESPASTCEFTVLATARMPNKVNNWHEGYTEDELEYAFHFRGVSITTWEITARHHGHSNMSATTTGDQLSQPEDHAVMIACYER